MTTPLRQLRLASDQLTLVQFGAISPQEAEEVGRLAMSLAEYCARIMDAADHVNGTGRTTTRKPGTLVKRVRKALGYTYP